jgi:hypothetical protein
MLKRSAKSNKSLIQKSEVALNKAFDGLNLCELRIRTTSSELEDILVEVLQGTVEIYKRAHQLYQIGEFKKSLIQAEIVCEMCALINNFAEEKAANTLNLPLPPLMKFMKQPMPKAISKIHPSLRLLDAMIRRRMTGGSKYYRERLEDYNETLTKVSEELKEIGFAQ